MEFITVTIIDPQFQKGESWREKKMRLNTHYILSWEACLVPESKPRTKPDGSTYVLAVPEGSVVHMTGEPRLYITKESVDEIDCLILSAAPVPSP